GEGPHLGTGLLPCLGKTLPGFGNLEGWGGTRQRLPACRPAITARQVCLSRPQLALPCGEGPHLGTGLLPCLGKTLPGFGNLEGWGGTRQRLPACRPAITARPACCAIGR